MRFVLPMMEPDAELCLIDSAATNSILRETKYFQTLQKRTKNITTVAGSNGRIVGSGRAIVVLPNATRIIIEEAFLYPGATHTLLTFKDIRRSGYHVATACERGAEYLYITETDGCETKVVEKAQGTSSGLYYSNIKPPPEFVAMSTIFKNPESFRIWHERLGHPGLRMMRNIINSSAGHGIKSTQIPKEFLCVSCAKGKLITKPSYLKVKSESPSFLQRLHGDICGPIHPLSGPFRYFMVLIDASTKWSHVCLLSTRNHAFAKFIAQIIRLRASFPENRIQSIRMDNAGEFTSKAFNDYCLAMGIDVEHSVPHVHTQNGLAEALIKRIKFIARPLLLDSRLPTSCWGHAVLHAAALIQYRPSAYNSASPHQLARGQQPVVSHLRKFGCAVYVSISPPQRTSMGPHRKMGIYVGYESLSIIKYLEPRTGDLFKARYADSIFDEEHFPTLGGGLYLKECREIEWTASSIQSLDPRTRDTELEVQRIINLQQLANNLPDAFTDIRGVSKSHIPAANAPERVEIPLQGTITISTPHPRKRGRKPDDSVQAKRGRLQQQGTEENALRSHSDVPAATHPEGESPCENVRTNTENGTRTAEQPALDNSGNHDEPDSQIKEIATNYTESGELYNRKSTHVDIHFVSKIATDINEDPEPKSMAECRQRSDWVKWKEAIETELRSLMKRQVFGPVARTPPNVSPVGFKWVFVRKRDENNVVVRYKARLVAQGFTQRPGIDYDETYSPVMSGITFRFLISLAAGLNLKMQMMDVVTAYLYGSLDSDIYMKVPDGLKIPDSKPDRNMYSVKLQRALYGLKQSGRMWYNRLSEFLLKKGYVNDPDSPCVFIRKSQKGFCIISVYVDDLNIIGCAEDIEEACAYLKTEFEMKDLGKTKFCLGLQIEHLPEGIFLHQSTYCKKVLERFYMIKAHPIRTPMVVRSIEKDKDPFRPRGVDEEPLGPEVPYLSAIGALMYLANNTRPDIAFAVNLLARHSADPTRRHWVGVKTILRYLKGTQDLGLYFSKKQDQTMVGYADAGYLSDPHSAKSQTGFVFLWGGTAVSWKSCKQTLVATSTNHSEIIALYEAARECAWLRRMTNHIQKSCGLSVADTPTVIHEDNAACIAQMETGYIKNNLTKHISPKYYYPHELQQQGEIKIMQVKSSDNLADMFTKSLPPDSFERCVRGIGMRRLRDLLNSGGECPEN